MRHWYVVHRQGKRLSAVVEAFKQFALKEGRVILRLPSVGKQKKRTGRN